MSKEKQKPAEDLVGGEDLNEMKKTSQKRFGLEEEPLIFYFDRFMGPLFFISKDNLLYKTGKKQEKQNRIPYIDDATIEMLARTLDMDYTFKLESMLNPRISLRIEVPKGEAPQKTHKWVFMDYIELENKEIHGERESFATSVVSGNPSLEERIIEKVSDYFKQELQAKFPKSTAPKQVINTESKNDSKRKKDNGLLVGAYNLNNIKKAAMEEFHLSEMPLVFHLETL